MVLRVSVLAGAVLLVVAGLTARLFVWPATNTPVRVGAIVVLGGVPGGEAEGVALAKKGYAPILAISQAEQECPGPIPRVHTVCFTPRPFSTQGEGALRRCPGSPPPSAEHDRGARDPQATRARLRFERCFSGRILIVPVRPTSLEEWVDRVFYEWGALGKALLLQRGC